MNDILVSIIIPVYNRDNTIGFCLSQLIRNTQNIEIIVVNDGSTDKTESIVKQYQTIDGRIKYFYQENKGVSAARNLGLEKAVGHFIAFCDSDDCIAENVFSLLNENTDVDLYIFNHSTLKYKNDLLIPSFVDNNPKTEIIQQDIVDFVFGKNILKRKYYSVWAKIFSNKIIRENCITFHEDVNLGEDQIFVCEYLRYTKKLCFVESIGYYNIIYNNIEHLGGGYGRSPQNFLYNAIENYRAISLLAKDFNSKILSDYSINYILDRPYKKIFLGHLKTKKFSMKEWEKLWCFAVTNILPVWNKLQLENVKIINKNAKRAFNYLLQGKKHRLYFLCVRENINIILKKYKGSILRRFSL